ncbi:MAG TPA: hypothetical protein VJJ78_01675 [Candidatus Saccharimonadales bacterium]|nr:hypothetical protein [Candidatus Saccharimonadales bacterium]
MATTYPNYIAHSASKATVAQRQLYRSATYHLDTFCSPDTCRKPPLDFSLNELEI